MSVLHEPLSQIFKQVSSIMLTFLDTAKSLARKITQASCSCETS